MTQVKHSATPDSSFWINVHRSGLLDHVLQRFKLFYTPAVGQELKETFASGREFWRLARAGVIGEASPRLTDVRLFGPGEQAAINLALEHRDWFLLIDDWRPLREAQRLGLRTMCTPVLVATLFEEGQLESEAAILGMAKLSALQTVSPTLMDAALVQIGLIAKRRGG